MKNKDSNDEEPTEQSRNGVRSSTDVDDASNRQQGHIKSSKSDIDAKINQEEGNDGDNDVNEDDKDDVKLREEDGDYKEKMMTMMMTKIKTTYMVNKTVTMITITME